MSETKLGALPTIPEPEQNAVVAIQRRAMTLEEAFESLPDIETDEAYQAASRLDADAGAVIKQVDALTEATVKAAYEAHKAAKAMQNGLKAIPLRIQEAVRVRMRRYLNLKAEREKAERERQERLLREARERQAEEARQAEAARLEAERLRFEAEAAAARATAERELADLEGQLLDLKAEIVAWGPVEDPARESALVAAIAAKKAELGIVEETRAETLAVISTQAAARVEAAAQEILAAPIPQIAVASSLAAAGLKFRTEYKWRIKDESQIPDRYYVLDTKLIDAEVRARKLQTRIDGIEVYEEKVPVTGRQ